MAGSYISTDSSIKEPRFGNAWRAPSGTIHATVSVSTDNATFLAFDSAAVARALAAVCTEAAEALDRLEAEGGEASDDNGS